MPIRTTLSRSVALAALAWATFSAHAIMLVAATTDNRVVRFDDFALASTAVYADIRGLGAGDRFVSIDLRPSNDRIYGITLSNRMYMLNEVSGDATFVTTLSANIIDPALSYEIDFDAVPDHTGAGPSLRVLSSAGDNYAVDANTGAVRVDTPIAGGYTGLALNSGWMNPAPTTTVGWYVSPSTDVLALATGNFEAPNIVTVPVFGTLGVDVTRINGFEIGVGGLAFGAFTLASSAPMTTGIYFVGTTSGAATFKGELNAEVVGLTSVSSVPEPSACVLAGCGLLVTAAVARRRRGAPTTTPRRVMSVAG